MTHWDNAFQFQLFRLIVSTLVMIIIWHFYAKVRTLIHPNQVQQQKSQSKESSILTSNALQWVLAAIMQS